MCCMCVHVCVWVCLSGDIPSVCVRMRRCACRHRQARACMRAAACARVRCSVRDGVRARRHTADASRASRQLHLTASLCETCRAKRAHARRASDHSCQPAAASLASLAVLALAPHTAVGADGGATALHALAPHSVVLADGGAPAVLALAPLSVVLADGGAPCSPCTCSSVGCARRWRRPRSRCIGSSLVYIYVYVYNVCI
jgi:hypothetical protein